MLGYKWMWSRPEFEWWAKLSAAGPPRVRAFEKLQSAERWVPSDVPPCETSGDVAPGVSREPSLQGSGVEGAVLRGSLRAVSTTRLSKAPFFRRAGLSQVGLYRTHFCLCQGWGAEHLLRRPASFGLKHVHWEVGPAVKRPRGRHPSGETQGQVQHVASTRRGGRVRGHAGIDTVSHTWGRCSATSGLSHTALGAPIGGQPDQDTFLTGEGERLGRLRCRWPGQGKCQAHPLRQGGFLRLLLGKLNFWMELPRLLCGKESVCQCKRHGFNPWSGKIPWRRKWQLTPVFLPGEFHGQRCLADYSPWGWLNTNMWASEQFRAAFELAWEL